MQYNAVLPDDVVFCSVLDVIALTFLMVLKSCMYNALPGVVQVSSVLYSSAMSDRVKRSGTQWCHV